MPNKAFKSDSQRLAVSLRSSIAKRRSHLNAALCAQSFKQAGLMNNLFTYISAMKGEPGGLSIVEKVL
ncbi:hypothetical protein VB546_25795, partial [Vibrio parahaemolyticus]|nr:hypothetical protein [Vibrio parahaemolyticus]